MADLNMNTKLPNLNAINGFVRENLVKPLQNSQKAGSADSKDEMKNILSDEKRQTIATDSSSAEALPKEELDETIRQLNDSLQNVQRNLEFSVDKDAGRIVINVKDKETDEVLRQIPSEEVLELARNLHHASMQLNQDISERSDSYTSQSSTGGVFLKTSV